MVFLGHIGIGKRMARPWSHGLPVFWLVLGTVLPDLIDKPLYYGLVGLTGKHGSELGLISGTRTLGHTLILAGVVWLFSLRGSARARALALGLLTHFALDLFGDLFEKGFSSALLAGFFPLFGAHFHVMPFLSPKQHLMAKLNPIALGGELLGMALLIQEWLAGRKIRLAREVT
jgi:hypothetical protein